MVCASAAKHTGVNCVTVTMADVGLERMATVGAIVELVAAPVLVGRMSLGIALHVTADRGQERYAVCHVCVDGCMCVTGRCTLPAACQGGMGLRVHRHVRHHARPRQRREADLPASGGRYACLVPCSRTEAGSICAAQTLMLYAAQQ